jgi:L-rhamnose mutarotase
MGDDVVRLGLTATIRDDPSAILEYVVAHQTPWPEVLADAAKAGVRITCIFRDGRRLFMYLEADRQFALDAYAGLLSSPRTLEWQERMNGLLEDQPGAVTGLKWRALESVITTSRD